MLSVAGSVNLDIVATAKTLPAPGETVTGARLARYPGGKGANQALAARRLGMDTELIAAIGNDDMAQEALALLREDGVSLSRVFHVNGETTGVALIAVDAQGENQIIVAPGANATLGQISVTAAPIEHLVSVLEIPPHSVTAAALHATGLVTINLAPAMQVPADLLTRADVLVVNEAEAAFYGDKLNLKDTLVAISLGAKGAVLKREGHEIASAAPPDVKVVDTVGAGDTFTAALAVALIEGRSEEAALRFAVTASALSCTKRGAQPSLPDRKDVDALLKKGS